MNVYQINLLHLEQSTIIIWAALLAHQGSPTMPSKCGLQYSELNIRSTEEHLLNYIRFIWGIVVVVVVVIVVQ